MPVQPLNRWLLVNYAGYPFAPNSLMPDNGLANLAGALHEQGRQVEILDCCTVSMLERFSSPALTARLTKAWSALRGPREHGLARARQLMALASLKRGERERHALQIFAEDRIAADVLARIRRTGIQAVGFKLWSGDGWEGAVRIASEIRRRAPAVRIFGGGPQVDVFMENLIPRCVAFDALVYGEGETTICRLAESGRDRASYADIPNLLFAREGRAHRTEERIVENLDALPMPLYGPDVYPAMAGEEKVRIIVVDESRGCQNNCAFCSHPVKSSHRLRVKGVPRIVREMEGLGQQLGIHTFRLAGSCTPYSLLNELATEILGRKLNVTYTSFAHVRGTEAADFRRLRESGCLALFFGIESGSQPVLDRMRKGTRAEMIAPAIRRAGEAGIFTVGSLIYPAPGDTPETEKETLALLDQAKPGAVTVAAPIVTPRTDWFENAEKYGIRYRSREHYLEAALGWKLSLLLPPAFWGPLPVAIDGQPYKQILRKTTEFVRRLEQAGHLTSASDDTFLMSQKAGIDVAAFRDSTRMAFFTGDTAGVRSMVERINAGA